MAIKKQLKDFEHHHAALLIFLLVASAFFINVFAFSQAYESVEKRQNVVLQPARLETQSVTTEAPQTQPEEPEKAPLTRLEGLDSKILSVLNDYDVNIAVVVQDLDTDEYLGINDSTTFVSASMYKLFVAYEVARQADAGLISFTDDTGSDGTGKTITQCLWDTLSYSDNPCGRALRKLIDADNSPSNAIAEAGFLGTALVNDYPTTSARDVALFFNKMYNQSDFSESANAKLLAPLLDQQVDNRIPQGLAADAKISHKTADLDGYSHDGGIIYSTDGDYILTILSGPWPNGYSDSPAAHIAITEAVSNWMSTN